MANVCLAHWHRQPINQPINQSYLPLAYLSELNSRAFCISDVQLAIFTSTSRMHNETRPSEEKRTKSKLVQARPDQPRAAQPKLKPKPKQEQELTPNRIDIYDYLINSIIWSATAVACVLFPPLPICVCVCVFVSVCVRGYCARYFFCIDGIGAVVGGRSSFN